MDRLRRLDALWNWLPAFRAVAETQHLKKASLAMRVAPSALSRSVKLLEDRLGKPLFDRDGRNVRLNRDGEELLAAVRDGMRRIDDSLDALSATALTGAVHVGMSEDVVLDILTPALSSLRAQHPNLTGHVRRIAATDAVAMLLRGALDVAFLCDPPASTRLEVEHLGRISYGVYCGKGHVVRTARGLDVATVLQHAFVAPIEPDGHRPMDQWPAELRRRVAMYLPSLEHAIEACAEGGLLAVLPDLAVARAPRRGLVRLAVEIVPHTELFAVRRPPLASRERAGIVIEAVRTTLRDVRRVAPKRRRPFAK